MFGDDTHAPRADLRSLVMCVSGVGCFDQSRRGDHCGGGDLVERFGMVVGVVLALWREGHRFGLSDDSKLRYKGQSTIAHQGHQGHQGHPVM